MFMNDSNEKSGKSQTKSLPYVPTLNQANQRVYTSYKGVHRPLAPTTTSKRKKKKTATLCTMIFVRVSSFQPSAFVQTASLDHESNTTESDGGKAHAETAGSCTLKVSAASLGGRGGRAVGGRSGAVGRRSRASGAGSDGGSGGAGLGGRVAGVADAGGEGVGGRVVGLAVVGEGLGAELVGDAVDLCLGGMC